MNLTIQDIANLRAEYEKAVRAKQESFMWQQQEMLTAYAKYLLEYLEGK